MKIRRAAIVVMFSLFAPAWSYAATLSGGTYTLNGSPTAISSAQSSGGSYSEQATADPANGNASGGSYTATPANAASSAASGNNPPNAPAPSNTTSSNNYSSASATGGSNGPIVVNEIPVLPSSGNESANQTPSPQTASVAGAVGSSGATSRNIALSQIKIIRSSPSGITVRFATDASAIGTVSYALPSGAIVTVTDSKPSTIHSFTIVNLTPTQTYTFNLNATAGNQLSDDYRFTVAPVSLGTEGSSVSPTVERELPPVPDPTAHTGATASRFDNVSTLVLLLRIVSVILSVTIFILWVRRRAREHDHSS